MASSIYPAYSSSRVFIAIRIILGVVFLWASVPKIVDPRGFSEILKNYQVLPPVLLNPVAVIMPWIEALCGLSLVSGRLIRGGALIFVLLMVIFSGLTGFNIYRGLDITCGCFSVAENQAAASQWVNLLRNLFLLGAGIFVLRQARADKDRTLARE